MHYFYTLLSNENINAVVHVKMTYVGKSTAY